MNYGDNGEPVNATGFLYPDDDDAVDVDIEQARRDGAHRALEMIASCVLGGRRLPRKMTPKTERAISRRWLVAMSALGHWTVGVKNSAEIARRLGVSDAAVCQMIKRIRRDMVESNDRIGH